MRLSHRVPIIKAVGDACNLRCDYCFYNGTDQKPGRHMPYGLLEQFLEQYFALFSGELCFVWHGGEPLLAGVSFYQNALELQRKFAKPGDVIENRIQTNATLITDDWAKFFRDNKFRVGVSLDGCRMSHDRHRKNVGGHGTFDEAVRGIEILKKYDIVPGVIQTVTRGGVHSIPDDFNFFVSELRIGGWAVNLFADDSSPNGKLESEGLRDEDVHELYEKLLQLWLLQDNEGLCIREIENAAAGVTGHRSRNCSFNGTCANYFCLDSSGRIWPCDRLSNDVRYALGDLNKETLRGILEGSASECHAERASQLSDRCVSCRWRSACNNGCTAMRDPDTGVYVYCNARTNLFEALAELLDTKTQTLPVLPVDSSRS